MNEPTYSTEQTTLPVESEYADELPSTFFELDPGEDPYRSTGKWRVMMSPAVEENFGHFDAKERIKQAEFLREIAKQLEMSARVALADQKPRKLNPMRDLERSEICAN